ncbi:MAG TPA: IPT/TIG domain-containing protein [Thermoanaerobaculia bacterium]|nr:IPT/TIG domain-containing protein [Thermoanaerobaculia bacterium]
MKSAFLLLALAAVFLCIPADAQSCSYAYPYDYDAQYDCTRTDASGSCAMAQAVTFSVRSYWSDSPLSCATVDWNFGDGSPVVTAAATASVPHTYAAAGTYEVQATLRANGSYYTFTNTERFSVSVANGTLQWSTRQVLEGRTASFAVTRTNTAGTTSMTWTLRRPDGSVPDDVAPTSGTVTFADGAAVASFDVVPADDAAYEPSRQYRLKAGTPTGGFLPPGDVTLYVDDNDQPILDFAARTIEVPEQDGVVAVTVQRVRGDVNVPVGVSYGVSGHTGIIGTSGRLTFAAGELSRSFNVVLTNDRVWTGDRSVTVEISNPTGGAQFPTSSYWLTSSLTVREDDPAPALSISETSAVEGNSGRIRRSFVLTSSAPVHGSVYFRLVGESAQAGEDFVATGGWLSFTPTRQQITVSFDVIGDEVVEEDEILRVEFVDWDVFARPQPMLLTILNDDAGVTPSRLRVPAGGSGAAYVDAGSPVMSPMVILLSSSDPFAASVPESVTIPAGERKAHIPITGVTAHHATEISVQFPPERGTKRFTITVNVDGSAQLAFEPSSVKAVAGQRVPLQIRMQPAPPNVIEIPLEVLNAEIAKTSRTVVIDTTGTGSLELEALQPGFTVIRATLPDTFGGQTAVLDLEVTAASDQPSLTSVTPATGPVAGGTRFTALGSHLTADCTLSFGGAPATELAAAADGTLAGVTPPHPAGTVDVALVCGTSRSLLPRAFTYLSTPPALTAIAPAFGSTAGGTLVRATGANFQSGCWLFFGDRAAQGVFVDSTTSLVGTTPPRETPGIVDASVRCGDARAFVSSSYAYVDATEPGASIISISPLWGAPGERVTLTGARFRASDRIDFDGVPATVLRARPDEQVLRIPELPLGLAAITLTDAEGRVFTTGPIFTVVEPQPPQVVKVSPSTALPGSEVVLEGRGFRPAYLFAVGGLPAMVVSLDYDRVVVRLADTLTPGAYPVHVLNAAGKVAAVGPSVRIDDGALRVATVAPSCGSTDGGTALVISGTGFEAGATVTLNGVAASDVVIVNAAELRATAPPGTDGDAMLVVTNPDGSEARITGAFRYSSPFDPLGCLALERALRP